jgi:hypothetical protein
MFVVPPEFYRVSARLLQHDDFQQFMEILRARLHEQDVQNRSVSGEQLLRGQGWAQCLAWLIEHVDGAPGVVHRS